MSFREITMQDVSEVLRRWQAGQSARRIARETGLDRKTVARYVKEAQEGGLVAQTPVTEETFTDTVVRPVDAIHMILEPDGFFDRNPAMDVPDPAVIGAWRRQLLWLGISIVALALVMRVQVKWFEWAAAPLYFIQHLFAVALGFVVSVIGGDQTAGAIHVVDDETWVARNVSAHMTGDDTRVGVVSTSCRKPDGNPNRLTCVKVLRDDPGNIHQQKKYCCKCQRTCFSVAHRQLLQGVVHFLKTLCLLLDPQPECSTT